MSGDLTFIVAVAAGLLSFLSPCVLPLVPAYLGQLTRVAVRAADSAPAGSPGGPARWVALRHAFAYVAGFGLVFTLLGVTATYAGGALVGYLPILREIGGIVLIVMGLNLAGILTIDRLQRSYQPLLAGGASSLATSGGGSLAGTTFGPDETGSRADRLGARLTGSRHAWLATFGLGVIFAVGWTPCIGTILGGILTLAATSDGTVRGGILLVGYTLGLGIPFIVLGVLYDRAPALLRPLQGHGHAVSLVSGLLVAAIGVAMLFDLLTLIPRYFNFSGV
ncbi:MAG: cytochrome c biogenesis CcdA family protein [Candidatus Limnocylindrales bacterium]|jgi:cytochrome c-type biogenesis protein